MVTKPVIANPSIAVFRTWSHGLLSGKVTENDLGDGRITVRYSGAISRSEADRIGLTIAGIGEPDLPVKSEQVQIARRCESPIVRVVDGVKIVLTTGNLPEIGEDVMLACEDGKIFYGRYSAQRVKQG